MATWTDTQYNSDAQFRFLKFKTINGKARQSSSKFSDEYQFLRPLHKSKPSSVRSKRDQGHSSCSISGTAPFAGGISADASDMKFAQLHYSEMEQDWNPNVTTSQISTSKHIESSINTMPTSDHQISVTLATSTTSLNPPSVLNSLTRTLTGLVERWF